MLIENYHTCVMYKKSERKRDTSMSHDFIQSKWVLIIFICNYNLLYVKYVNNTEDEWERNIYYLLLRKCNCSIRLYKWNYSVSDWNSKSKFSQLVDELQVIQSAKVHQKKYYSYYSYYILIMRDSNCHVIYFVSIKWRGRKCNYLVCANEYVNLHT